MLQKPTQSLSQNFRIVFGKKLFIFLWIVLSVSHVFLFIFEKIEKVKLLNKVMKINNLSHILYEDLFCSNKLSPRQADGGCLDFVSLVKTRKILRQINISGRRSVRQSVSEKDGDSIYLNCPRLSHS